MKVMSEKRCTTSYNELDFLVVCHSVYHLLPTTIKTIKNEEPTGFDSSISNCR